ncbi:MAG: autorepressor SdpR family transcription factor [Lachnospiraceae bacterium]|nr:autorepressor SdpR family transcription factor [Lachnospiraceae bacterium]MDE6699266.1 autorepressor SdpR family transcription factor [Lachnospiraceae bacterium]
MGLANTFKALSEPLRRRILELLKKGRMTAGELSQELKITPPALSYHLKLLKQADLIIEYKYKNFIYYEINTSVLDELILWTGQFKGEEAERKFQS